jgi:hypothetical protein
MSSIGAQTGTIGTAISITPMASDADSDSDSVTWSASALPSGLSINPTSGAITGTPDTNQAVSTTVSIDDGYGGADSETFSFTIANTAPVLAAFGEQASTSGVAVSLSPSASDVNGDTLSWSATDLPSGLSIDPNSGAITGTPDTVAGYTTIISVADGLGGTDSESVTWNVVAGNSAPMVSPIADRVAIIDEAVSFTPTASDANGDTISYAASGLPAGLAINAGTGAITGTPSSLGTYNVTITVADPDDAESSTAFVWTISEAAAATQGDDNEISSTPSADATITPMIDSNVREMFDITRQSIVPVIRMSSKIGLSRLAELRENAGHNRTNRSSHNIQLAFNDKGLQQVADGGFNSWTDDLANLTSDFVLPEGMAAWSRTQSIMGSLKTASSDKSVNIDGNNITFGIDYRYTPELTLGGFYQRANSETRSLSQNAETDLNAGLFMIYGSLQLAPDYYLQGGVGTGKLEFEINRTVNGDDYSAQRNGEKSNWMLAISRHYEFNDFDITLSLDSAYQSIELDGYRESSGMATYQYLRQEMRTYYVGGSLLFAQEFENELGLVNLTGEIGYQADMSDDTVARAFLLADPSTVYEYRMDADDDEQSLSHSSLVLGASLLTDSNWSLNASADFFVYESGTLTGLTLSAARRF